MFNYETCATRRQIRRAALLACMLVAWAGAPVSAANAPSDGAVRELSQDFAKDFLQKNPAARASLFVQDGTIVLPPGAFLQGRAAMMKDFSQESQQLVNPTTRVTFSNYRVRFIKSDVAFVDTLLTAHNLNAGKGKVIPETRVDFSYVAVRQASRWLIEDARLHFAPAQPKPAAKAQTSNM